MLLERPLSDGVDRLAHAPALDGAEGREREASDERQAGVGHANSGVWDGREDTANGALA